MIALSLADRNLVLFGAATIALFMLCGLVAGPRKKRP